MPEKALGPGYAGMASVVDAGSCDSVASITSNHSALSDESYDYLSAEERDVLMYLEETIDSLDAEGDSGLSTDDSERAEEVLVPPTSPKKGSPENSYESKYTFTGSPGQKTVKKNENGSLGFSAWNPEVASKPGYNSLPKNLMIPRVELIKDATVQPVPVPVQPVPAPAPVQPVPAPTPVQPVPAPAPDQPVLVPTPVQPAPVQPVPAPVQPVLVPAPVQPVSYPVQAVPASFQAVLRPVRIAPSSTANTSLTPEKPKRWSLAAVSEQVPSISEIGFILPPEPFRDMHPILKRASMKKGILPISDQVKKSDFVDGTSLQGISRVALETNQSLVASPRNIYPSKEAEGLLCTPLQHDPAIPVSAGDPEPVKEMVNLQHVVLQQSKQLHPVSPVNAEPQKEPEALRTPHWLPVQGLRAVPGNVEFAKESGGSKHLFQQPIQITPASKSPNPEMSHPPKGQMMTKPLLLPMTEEIGNDTDQKNVPLTSQAHREHSALQENLQHPVGKTVDPQFKHGPPTQPKPLKLPPHIIVKPSHVNYSIDPEQRSRTKSLTILPATNRNRSSSVKTHIIKDQLTARQEALEKLKLSQVQANSQSASAVTSSSITKVEKIPTPQTGTEKVANDKIVSDKVDLHDTNPTINHATSIAGVRSRQFPIHQENTSVLNTNKVNPAGLSETTAIPIPQLSRDNPPNHGKVEENSASPKSRWQDKINTFSVSPEKVYGGVKSMEFPLRQPNMEFGKESPPTNSKVSEDQNSAKHGKQDQQNKPFTNPEKASGGLRSEFPPSQITTEKESLSTKTKVLSSSQHDLRPGFRFAQGPSPGLREINFKSNTLERSGIGMSTNKDDDEQNRNSSSSSIFQKPTSSKFTTNFLKKNRPRPASMGTAVEFKAIKEAAIVPAGDSEVAKPESRRSSPFTLFSPKPRPTSLISVKITPKSSADEHREALRKLGLLHE